MSEPTDPPLLGLTSDAGTGVGPPAPGGPPGPVGPPLMRSRRIALRPIRDVDMGFLYSLMSEPRLGGRVRWAGATPSPEQVASTLWESVLAQFVMEEIGSGRPIGLVAITSPNFRDGFAYVSALGLPERRGLGAIAEGAFLGFHYAFSTWPFRKIYMESTEESYRQFASGLGTFFVEEGRLRRHVFWNGQYVDLAILAVYREQWAQRAPGVLARLAAPEAAGDGEG